MTDQFSYLWYDNRGFLISTTIMYNIPLLLGTVLEECENPSFQVSLQFCKLKQKLCKRN